MCVCEGERESVCVCVCEGGRESVCACVLYEGKHAVAVVVPGAEARNMPGKSLNNNAQGSLFDDCRPRQR